VLPAFTAIRTVVVREYAVSNGGPEDPVDDPMSLDRAGSGSCLSLRWGTAPPCPSLPPVRVVVTGGAGFIGSHLTDTLLARGHEVVCVDDLSKGSLENIAHHSDNRWFRFAHMDIRNGSLLEEAGRGCAAVVHLAAAKIARYDSAFHSLGINLDGARAALELARVNNAKFVLGSTSDVYGKNPSLPFGENSDLVIGPSTSRRWSYAVSKLCDEHLAFAYEDEFGLPICILRFFGTYGARQYLDWWGGPQGVFLQAIAEGAPVEIHGDGKQSRCFIHVSDLVEGIARAIERDQTVGEIVNIGNDEEITIVELARLMHELSGTASELQLEFIPYTTFTANYEDVRRRVPDTTKMRALLELEPRVDLRRGISMLWDWYRTRSAAALGSAVSPNGV